MIDLSISVTEYAKHLETKVGQTHTHPDPFLVMPLLTKQFKQLKYNGVYSQALANITLLFHRLSGNFLIYVRSPT